MRSQRLIVLDKSYIQDCKDEDLTALTKNGRLLVTAELFHEILTDDKVAFRVHFKKLLKFRKYIDIIDHLGTILKYEIDNLVPCTPLSDHFIPGILNVNYNFNLTDDQNDHIKGFFEFWEVSSAKEFEEVVLEIWKECSELKPKDIAQNKELVLRAYEYLKSPNLPSADKINQNWAIFRKLQIDLIASLDYMHSYSDGYFNITKKNKAHDQIDFRICIFALLTKTIATRDKKIIRYFKLLCPEGQIF